MSPVEIDIEYRYTRASAGFYMPKDIGNAAGSLKSAVDGLADAGVIPCDTARWLQWGRFNLFTKPMTDNIGPGVYVTVRQQ